ncbi:hypothetical protein SALBM311S_11095 [Streptomyces alboniger]
MRDYMRMYDGAFAMRETKGCSPWPATLRWAHSDLRTHRGEALFLVLATAGIVASLLLATALFGYATNPWQRVFAQAHGAHVWLHTGPSADVREAAGLDGVESVSGPYPTESATLASRGARASVELRGTSGRPTVGRPLVTSGHWLDAGTPDGVVLESRLARALLAEPGDTLSVPGTARRLTVLGIADSAEPRYRPGEQPGLVWALPSAVRDPGGQVIGLRLSDPDDTDYVVQRAVTVLGSGAVSEVSTWQQARAEAQGDSRLLGQVLGLFGLGALVAAGLAVHGAIATRIRGHLRDISVLKADRLHAGPGGPRLPVPAHRLRPARRGGRGGAHPGTGQPPPRTPRGRGRCVAGAAGAHGGTVRGAGGGGAADRRDHRTRGLAGGAGSSGAGATARGTGGRAAFVRGSPGARAAAAARTGPRLAQGVRAAPAVLGHGRPARVAAAADRGRDERLDHHRPLPEQARAGRCPGRVSVRADSGLGERDTRDLLERDPGVAAAYPGVEVAALVPGQTATIALRGLGTHRQPYPYALAQGRAARGPDEAVAGQGLLDLLDVSVGDWVRMTVGDQPQILHIVGRSIEPENAGRVISTSLDTLRENDPDLGPTQYQLRLHPGTNPQVVAARLATAGRGHLDVHTVPNPADGLSPLRGVVVGLIVVLALIGLIEVLTAIGGTVREGERNLLALKAIGLSPRQITAVTVTATGCTALAAVLIGTALGAPLALWLIDAQGRSSGIGAGIAQGPSPSLLTLFGAAAVLGAAALATVPTSRAARRRLADTLSAVA